MYNSMEVDGLNRSVRQLIQSRRSELPAKQQLVAEFVLANPTRIPFASTKEVAEASGVDPSTVVRFAQNVGFEGYKELRQQMRMEFPNIGTPLDSWDDDLIRFKDLNIHGLVESVRVQTRRNLESTFEELDPLLIERVALTLLGSRRSIVVGGGSSLALSLQLQRVLQVAQIPTTLIDDWFGLLFEGASFESSDVVFGITSWRYAKMTIETLRIAKDAGSETILLTDSRLSPAMMVADTMLLYSPRAIGELASPVAGAAIIDCIAGVLMVAAPDPVRESMEKIAKISTEHGLTFE